MHKSEYQAWMNMKDRCGRSTRRGAHNYVGRGIAVCDRWSGSFESFLADMGPKPSPVHSLDRIDNDKGYEPGNCRWATRDEQSRNTRRNTLTEKIVSDALLMKSHGASTSYLARVLGVPLQTLEAAISGRNWKGVTAPDDPAAAIDLGIALVMAGIAALKAKEESNG
jgi:hypothetical protein